MLNRGGEVEARCPSHGGCDGDRPDRFHYLTVRVFRLRKSIRMNWPSVIVVVKYALPRLISLTRFTKSTSARSRASMNVLIMIPDFRQAATSCSVFSITVTSRPNEFL